MANFEIPDNPVYNTELRQLEPTDPATAVLFNSMFAQMIENDAALKKEIAQKTKVVFLSKDEYDVRLAAYREDNTYIDPDTEVLFSETIYYIDDDYDELVRNASNIEYTDTMELGSTNVQGAIDKLVERVKLLENSIQ